MSGAATASFLYDADGKQVKAVVGSTTTYYVGMHYQVDNGVVTKYYLAGASRIAMRKNGTLYYLLGDHLGSTSITLNSSGTKIAELRYKAWGETRYSSGTTYTAYQFTSQRNETALGLYFYNARWYDPSLGRFTSADTLVPGGVQGYDRYAYANNNPVRYNDPTGHWGFDLSATVNSFINWELSGVNALLGTGFTSSDVAKGCDTLATVLDAGAALISSAIAAGEIASATTGYLSGAGVGFALGGEPAVATGPLGAAVGVGIFELSPEVRVGAALSDGMGWASTGLTALSDIITGDTNITGSVSVSGGSMHVAQSSSIGRDTVSTLYLSGLGQMAPLGIIDAPIDYAGLAFDSGLPWKIWPFSEVPESIPVTNVDVEIDY